MTTHKCNKETEIELIKQQQKYIIQKLDQVHEKILGNGKPGLYDEMRELKTGLKTTQIILGVAATIIAIVFTILNYVRG